VDQLASCKCRKVLFEFEIDAIITLMDMGFRRKDAMAALIKNGFDVSLAFLELDDGKEPRPRPSARTGGENSRAGGSNARNVTTPVPAAQTLVPAAPTPAGADAGG